MKIKIDENLPASLAQILFKLGHDAETVPQEGMAGKPDEQVWREVKKTGRFLITQDLDFSDIRQFAPGSHHGVLLVRLREPGRLALINRIRALFETEKVEVWKGSLVIATNHKIRIHNTDSSSRR